MFENEFGEQTLARGGFVVLPRGLEVRLVSRNPTDAAMPAGQVTVYATEGEGAQVVGQARVPLTPPGGEFSVALGRSTTLFGTRRVLERREGWSIAARGGPRDRLIPACELCHNAAAGPPMPSCARSWSHARTLVRRESSAPARAFDKPSRWWCRPLRVAPPRGDLHLQLIAIPQSRAETRSRVELNNHFCAPVSACDAVRVYASRGATNAWTARGGSSSGR